jgi:hypothetical protein
MSCMTQPNETPHMGMFSNALHNWPNDDILLTQEGRDALSRVDSRALELLDWPELRELFKTHDVIASNARSSNCRSGLTALAFAGVGLIIASISSLGATQIWEMYIRLVAEIFLLTGFIYGIWHLTKGRQRATWLLNRLWTERLRQLYFQQLINGINLFASGLSDVSAQAEFVENRRHALALLLQDSMKDPVYAIDQICVDFAEIEPWINHTWSKVPLVDDNSESIARALEIVGRQRIGIQLKYTRSKLRLGLHSPVLRSRIVRFLMNVLSICVVILGIITGLLVVFKSISDHSSIKLVIALASICGALVIILRSLDEGLRITPDAERYAWYLASVEALHARFYATTRSTERINILRELEHLSYQEMRRFLATHRDSRFLI